MLCKKLTSPQKKLWQDLPPVIRLANGSKLKDITLHSKPEIELVFRLYQAGDIEVIPLGKLTISTSSSKSGFIAREVNELTDDLRRLLSISQQSNIDTSSTAHEQSTAKIMK